jgi:hypothetical protein
MRRGYRSWQRRQGGGVMWRTVEVNARDKQLSEARAALTDALESYVMPVQDGEHVCFQITCFSAKGAETIKKILVDNGIFADSQCRLWKDDKGWPHVLVDAAPVIDSNTSAALLKKASANGELIKHQQFMRVFKDQEHETAYLKAEALAKRIEDILGKGPFSAYFDPLPEGDGRLVIFSKVLPMDDLHQTFLKNSMCEQLKPELNGKTLRLNVWNVDHSSVIRLFQEWARQHCSQIDGIHPRNY